MSFWLLAFAAADMGRAQVTDEPETTPAEEYQWEEPDLEREARVQSRSRQWPREIVQLGGTVEIEAGEEVRDVVVVFGSVRMNGTVRGDMVVVFGKAVINGEVKGSVVMPFSPLELGPMARVGRDLVVVLGSLVADPKAQILGQRVDFSLTTLEENLPPVEGLKHWVTQGLLWARPLPHTSGWWWWFAAACAALYLLVAMVFAQPVAAGVKALEERPVGSFFLGLLVFTLFGPLLLMLAATGIGLVVIPFVAGALVVAFVFGKVVLYEFLGCQFGRQLGLGVLRVPLIALLVGMAVFCAMYMVPIVGFLVWAVGSLLGVGAVIIAFLAAFRMESAPTPVLATSSPAASAPVVPFAPAMPVAVRPPLAESAISKPGRGEIRGRPVAPAPVNPPRIAGQPPVPALIEPSGLPRVGFWLRLGATFIDLLLVGVVVGLLERGPWFIPLWVTYHVGLWAWRGTTIGGVVFKLKIVRSDGRAIDFPVALIRSLAGFLSALALFIGFFWAGWTREKLAWHDLIAGTMIVKMPKGVPLL